MNGKQARAIRKLVKVQYGQLPLTRYHHKEHMIMGVKRIQVVMGECQRKAVKEIKRAYKQGLELV